MLGLAPHRRPRFAAAAAAVDDGEFQLDKPQPLSLNGQVLVNIQDMSLDAAQLLFCARRPALKTPIPRQGRSAAPLRKYAFANTTNSGLM
jgi:hypothetical protein